MIRTSGTAAPASARREHRYLQEVARRVVVFDGAMGTNIQRYGLTAEDFGGKEGCNDYLVITKPQVIEEIHRGFLEAGCDVIETCSFQSTRLRLAEWGLADRTREINVAAARLARRLADEYATPERPRFVAGSMGPTGMLPSSDDPALSNITFHELAELYAEQAAALLEGGVDLLLIETSQDILEVRAAIEGVQRCFQRTGRWAPLQVQVTLDTTGRMLLGTDIGAAMTTLQALPVDVIGLNCSTGPEHMREPVRFLAEHARLPISVIPNAGIPLNEGGRAVYPLEPEPMARALAEFVEEFGVAVVGGCCGTTAEHLRLLVEAVGGRPRTPRPVRDQPRVSSGMRSVTLHQEPKPLLVGERVNSQGSRRVKQLLLAEDYDGILQIAREQVDSGAHVLDVCVALTERADEAEQMRRAVRKIASGVEAPLMIDSTEAAVIQAALEVYPGRAIINSINLENGRERVDRVLPLARTHGAAVVALTIDEEGMAHTAEKKLAVARRIYEIATGEYGLPPDALIFDVLTFPVTTGQEELARSALETLEGIRRVKAELPGVFTILGVSNVSFGVKQHARAVLNSVFLHHAVEAGLDLAIVNPAHITPYAEIDEEQRRLCEDLLYARTPDALPRFIEYFERHGVQAAAQEQADPTEGMTVQERIHYQILHRKKEGIEALLDEAMREQTPVEILNTVLLPAMKDVGDKFGAGELILPFVLQSAEVMKRAVAHLEQFFERSEGQTKGKVVLATVFGDVHDIGKNLVHTILSNNGYTVYDLGKQVPLNTIIDTAVEVGADAIGLSALLVSTSKQMPLCVQELHRRGLAIPVIVGGAAINRAYGRRILFVDGETPYGAGVFYAKDAFEGLEIMDRLMDPAVRDRFVEEAIREAEAALHTPEADLSGSGSTERSPEVRVDVPVPEPPFWGWRVLDGVPLGEVWPHLDLNALFRNQWGGRVHGEAWERLVAEEFQPRLRALQAEAEAKGYLQPRVIYGYFPCQSSGNELIVYDPADRARELARFSFPRRPDRDRVCLADYFQPAGSGRMDVVAFQIVTVGSEAAELVQRLQQEGEYAASYFIHGLSVQTAEALAEYVHARVRRELGLGPDQGRRYSWGYPACPDLEEHEKLFRVLPAQETIGVSLSAGYQLVPEASTAAIVTHHPQSKYFSVRPSE
ncbi:MAG TPA: methionine synthase [Dehalococcoidia bacterium]